LREIDEIALLETSNGVFQSSYYCLSILLDKRLAALRFELVSKLNAFGVGTSVYYPKAVPDLDVLPRKIRLRAGQLPECFPGQRRPQSRYPSDRISTRTTWPISHKR